MDKQRKDKIRKLIILNISCYFPKQRSPRFINTYLKIMSANKQSDYRNYLEERKLKDIT